MSERTPKIPFQAFSTRKVTWLVVSTYPSEKYAKVSWDDEIPNIWENKKCSKPPTPYIFLDLGVSPRTKNKTTSISDHFAGDISILPSGNVT